MRLDEIYQAHSDKAQFFLIYIREAHAADGWVAPTNLYEGISHNQPTTTEERTAMAEVCRVELGLNIPMLVDTVDNATEEKYIAKPNRLFVIDKDGIVVYTGPGGPFGSDPDEWEDAIKSEAAAGQAAAE